MPSAWAGWSDWSFTNGAERRVGLVHAAANVTAIGAYAVSWLVRRNGHQRAGFAWSVAGATAMSVGGWLGGHLAYALGVGVDTTAFQKSEDRWTAVAPAADVSTGELTEADLDGVPLLLTRDDTGTVRALADRCTHRGAPLHEGKLVDGCVVCPWHDSAFALDGTVVHGPAVRPQPVYEVEERDGDVRVRRADDPRSLKTNPVGV